MIAAIKLKRFVTNTCIFYIVVCKLCHTQELYLVILHLINKNLEKNLCCTILPLCETTYPKIKDGRELLLDFKKIT